MDACDKSARRIKRDAKRRCSEQVGALLMLRTITACPPSAFFAPQRVCCERPTERKHHSPVIYRAWPPRLIFSHRIQPQSLCIFFFFFFAFFPFDKASYPSQSGKPGELRPPIDGDMARLHRFSAVIQASSSSDPLSKPRSDRIACYIRQPSIASQSLRSPHTTHPTSLAPREDDYLTLLSSASGAVEMRISQIASGRTSGWGREGV